MENTELGIIESILRAAKEKNASDIHLAAGMRPMFRVDGDLIPASEEMVEPEETESLLHMLLNEEQMKKLQEKGGTETVRSAGLCRVRLSAFRQRGSYAMTLHMLPVDIPSKEEIGLPDSLFTMAGRKSGLILIAGVTGSGKTTTASSFVAGLANDAARSVVTIERPIEYLFLPERSIVCQREVGADCITFASGIKAALRQDTDIILLGECKDAETASLAVTAAETGHLVVAVLHTDSAADATERLVGLYPIGEQARMRFRIANVLLGVTAQQLLPRREAKGRVAAFEVMIANPVIRSLICEEKTAQITAVIQSASCDGMVSMDDAIYSLYMKSRITAETAVRFARDTEDMQRKV